MKNNDLEKNIKNQLGSYENFDGDKMAIWDEIEQELDKKKKRGFFWIWFGMGFLLIGLATSWMIFDRQNEVYASEIQNSSTLNYEEDKAVKTKTSIETKTSTATDIGQISVITFSKKPNQEESSFSQKIIKKNSPTNTHNNTITKNIFNKNQNTNLNNSTTATVSADVEKELAEKKPKIAIKNDVTFLPKLHFLVSEKENDIAKVDSVYYFEPEQKDSSEYKWGISIGGGINTATTGYNNTSTFSNLRKKSESPLLGWSFQLELERRLPKDFFIASGIHFNRNWMRFDYNATQTSVQYLENVVIAFDLDLAIGDTTFYFGDTSVTTVTNRDVRHYNQYDKLKIPILFGKKWTKGKFSYGGFAGVGFDIWLRQKGKNLSINPEEIINTYDTKKGLNFINGSFPKFGISADFKGDLNYKIGKRHHLFFQPNVSVSLSNWSNSNYSIKQKPITFGINLGYQFKF